MNTDENLLFNEIVLLLAIAAFVLLLVLEGIKPHRSFARKENKNSLVTNTETFFFNNLILATLRASSLFFIAQQLPHYGLLSGLDTGPVKWVLSFLLFDLAIYGWHFASHKYEFLWRFHKIHHSDKSFNVSTGLRFHVLDLTIELFYKCLLVILLGIDAYTILAVESLELFFIFFHHSNLKFKNEESISKFIITPALHRTHHSTLRSEHDSNYGIVFAVWDKIFGTRKEDCVPDKIGLDLIEADNFIQLLFLAFITENQMKKIQQMIPRGKRSS